MSKLLEEVRLWNTPVVGAYLLWKFTSGYSEHHARGDGPSVLLHFLALAILTSPQLLDTISNRRANLQSYARGFEENGKTDMLLGIQERVRQKREYTLASIEMAVAHGILAWDVKRGKLYARPLKTKLSRGCRPKSTMEKAGNRAAILGMWLSKHDIGTISTYLGVSF